ncbi:MAG: amino acid adenylation domain-containing protein [Legionella sp.]|nr:amino acid adenylation domain-containing protein [Legionella sp.]
MLNKKAFSCYLIGDDHLLVQCAELLLENGHQILGIISPLKSARIFASTHHIDYFESLKDAMESLSTREFDYLFSIINSTILPAAVLKCARKLSINFHNAPLPRYAGVHALSWAILNEELSHGVTWHVMTEEIDGGDLLKQALFPIDAHETALSLSLKCYAHALTLFDELIKELSNQTLIGTRQDGMQRSYYGFKQKPRDNGWISWNSPATNIERTVRALNLGHYHHNRLASPKLRLGNDVFIINRLHILDEPSTAAPGTIVNILPNAWHISTETNLISVEQLAYLDGTPSSLGSLIENHQIQKGYNLPSPSSQQLAQYHSLSEFSATRELSWVRALIDFKPATLPFQPQNSHQFINDLLTPLAQSTFSKEQIHHWKAHLHPNCHSADVLLTAILIYLYRLGNKEQTGMWMHMSSVTDIPQDLKPFFASLVPFSVSFKNELSFYDAIESVRETHRVVNNHVTFQQDIFYRYPELASVEHHQYPLALFTGTQKQCTEKCKHTKASILITLSSDTNEITWWIKQQLLTQEPRLGEIIKASTTHLHCLLESLPKTIHQPISQLPIIGEDEQKKIMNAWYTTTSVYPKQQTIHQVFEAQAASTPDNIAVTYGKQSLTYKELNQKANQLACYLQKKGLLPHSFAAICTTQELHLIIGILAILKTGAAYIPIDASYPKQHIQYVLEDSKPGLLLASERLSERVTHDCDRLNIPVILFDKLADVVAREPIDNLKGINTTAQSLAYVIYTSGTTGKPKGVMVTHQGVVRLVKNTNYIHIEAHDRIAQAASISFDAATFEIWGALLNGAILVAVPHATLLDPTKFRDFLEKKEITILWLTAALFNQLAAEDPSIFRHLSYLLVGGDVLNKERIMSVLDCDQGSPRTLLNGYGPTENTTFTTTYHITQKDKQLETIPIGKPIANSFVYVLDELLQPVPVGAIGELYTGGDGLARGYLNRPDLNQVKFIKNPFGSDKNSKLYKTGDSVRWMPDGNIEYLGRQDNQVKIRGFRVELEAIQAHLLHHPAVSQSTVRAEESEKHAKVLVAYIVCKADVSDKALQTFIGEQLPAYMIPGFFVRLDKMPLTTNGKVNYKKLPKPDFTKTLSNEERTLPSTPVEYALATLWSTLLGCDTIGIDDNFFDLGGHSLLITQLILQVKNKYKTDLPLHEFLENPTIRHLNLLIDGNKQTAAPTLNNQNIFADRFLEPQLQLKGFFQDSDEPQHILLTGASGFLGAHLLSDLYHTTKAKIYCLIRANNEDDAIIRLNNTLEKYQLTLQCNERIVPLLGDLTRPQLGLSGTQFDKLIDEVDVIFHNGAAVNHLYNYELLRAANVSSTIDIISLAMQHKIKPIHYVSTLSAASNFLDESRSIIEGFMDAKQTTTPPTDGYSQTKWVAEQLLAEASSRGLEINIYRPGWIVGQTHTGAINAESNHLLMLLKGCIQLKVAPAWDMMLDMLPVDTVSNIIINTALHSKKHNNVFNLVNPNKISWTELIHYINQRGYGVSLIDPMIWKEEHLKTIDKENALYTLYPLYINTPQGDWMKGLSTISCANSYNTSAAFDKMGQQAPRVNEELLDTYFNYLEQQGFIKPADFIN